MDLYRERRCCWSDSRGILKRVMRRMVGMVGEEMGEWGRERVDVCSKDVALYMQDSFL